MYKHLFQQDTANNGNKFTFIALTKNMNNDDEQINESSLLPKNVVS